MVWWPHVHEVTVAERVPGQGSSKDVVPLILFFAERPVKG